MNKLTYSLGVLAVSGLMMTAAAQQSSNNGAGVVDPGHPRVNQVNKREQNQQNRIANGLKSGKMSAQQASNIEKREASVQNQEQKDMAAHNGHLTKAEQRQLNRRENRISKSIYKDKHQGK
jgi:hypothetical protein